jgi:hypothetical protein
MNSSTIQDIKRQLSDLNRNFLVTFIKVYLVERSIIPSFVACVVSGAVYFVANLIFYKKTRANYMQEALLMAKLNILLENLNNLALAQAAAAQQQEKAAAEQEEAEPPLAPQPPAAPQPQPTVNLMNLIEAHLDIRNNIEQIKSDMRIEPMVIQAWFGSFNISHFGRKLEGVVEIANTRLNTRKENRDWISQGRNTCPGDAYINQIVTHGTKVSVDHMKYYDWNGPIHCKIYLTNVEELRHISGPRDIIVRHYASISWTRKLIPTEHYI